MKTTVITITCLYRSKGLAIDMNVAGDEESQPNGTPRTSLKEEFEEQHVGDISATSDRSEGGYLGSTRPESDGTRQQGRVVSYNGKKGFGFVRE
jgi:hypothetical protein